MLLARGGASVAASFRYIYRDQMNRRRGWSAGHVVQPSFVWDNQTFAVSFCF